MIESSKDILWIVLAFCALWLTVFMCWAIYYLAMILKQTSGLMTEMKEILDDIKDKLRAIDEAIHAVKEKIENSAAYLALIADGAKYLISHFTGEKPKKGSKKKKAGEGDEPC